MFVFALWLFLADANILDRHTPWLMEIMAGYIIGACFCIHDCMIHHTKLSHQFNRPCINNMRLMKKITGQDHIAYLPFNTACSLA